MAEAPIVRFEKAIKLEETDRPPLGYLFFGGANWVLKDLGASFEDVYYSSEGIARAQIRAKELFGHDNVMSPWGCLLVEAEALGCTLKKKRDYYPSVVERPIKSEKDLGNLSIPNPYRDGRMPLVLESLRILSKQVGEHTPVIGMISSPVLVASEIRGYEELLMEMIKNPDFVHEILDVVTASSIEYVKAMCQEDVFAVMLENAFMNRDVLDRQRCKEFVLNYSKKLVDEIKKLDVYVVEHNCSRPESLYIDMELDLKPDVLNIAVDNTAMLRTRARDVCIMGNVNQNYAMLSGSKTDVYREARSCIKEGGPRGFILSTNCEIPFNAPLDSIKALHDVASAGW